MATTTFIPGLGATVAEARSVGNIASVASVAAFTVGAADGSFLVAANVLITAGNSFSFTVTCVYTDEGSTSRTMTFMFSQPASGTTLTIANAAGTVNYASYPMLLRAKAGTSITIATTGTFGTVTYNVEGLIQQVA